MLAQTPTPYLTANDMLIPLVALTLLILCVGMLIAVAVAWDLDKKLVTEEDFAAKHGRLTRRVYALEEAREGDQAAHRLVLGRLDDLATRLERFAALEELGLAAQLGKEMLAKTEAELTAMTREIENRRVAMAALQDQTLAHLRDELKAFEAKMADIGTATAGDRTRT